ncbi:tetratricopeptide repeat protein [Evansella halocellulosilytica]|uniref:tetratricopeptide repeat protein n=1 Tax=Evansella halocellulosilytica TaxID=2011013 RepID=UPI000BB9229C|nr:tetratricopeptide repeat protein [Evansella halocellulosilytica]
MHSSHQWKEMSQWLLNNKELLSDEEIHQWVEQLTKEQDYLLDVWSSQNELLEEIKDQLTTVAPFSFEKKEEPHEGISYFNLGLYKQAIRTINDDVLGKQNHSRLLLYLGYSYLYLEEPYHAREHFLDILQRSSDKLEHHFAYVGLGLQAGQEEKVEEAIHFFEKAENLLFNSDVVYNLGICYLLLKMPNEALTYFQKSFHEGDKDSESLFWIGKCFDLLGKKTEAMETWYEVIQMTKSSKLIQTLAFIFEEKGHFPCAIYCFERLNTLGFDHSLVLHGLAWNYGLLDERNKSKQLFSQLLKENPTDLNARISYLWLLDRWNEKELFKHIKDETNKLKLTHPLMMTLF